MGPWLPPAGHAMLEKTHLQGARSGDTRHIPCLRSVGANHTDHGAAAFQGGAQRRAESAAHGAGRAGPWCVERGPS